MLILSRGLNESIKIGDEVTVTVLGVQGTHVRLGFAAPPDVAVNREEVYLRRQANSVRGRADTAKGTGGKRTLQTIGH